MMRSLLFAACLFLGLSSGLGRCATLVCIGVLGNSGEQGVGLVRFAPSPASGMGVAYDRFGTLWDRGGVGTLNRYTVDGRLVGQYSIPSVSSEWNANHQIVLVGDTLVLFVGGQLYRLPVTSAPGTSATPMNVKADRIAWNSYKGSVAIAQGKQIALVQVSTGTVTSVATVAGSPMWLEMGLDGAIYPIVDWKLHKYVNGVEVTDGWPKDAAGERPQLLDGYWYGQTWNSTVKRFTADMQPAPGVILGGASGSFIGHLDQQAELIKGCGIVHLRDNLFAISGLGGEMHLLGWQSDKQQMTVLRRIGCIPSCSGLGLDRAGNVWYHSGSWKWTDLPDTPERFGVNTPEEVGQSVLLDDDCEVAPGWLWGTPVFYHGPLTGEVRDQRIESGCALARGTVAAAAYKDAKGKQVLLTLTKSGQAHSFFIGADGGYLGEAGPVKLTTTAPVAGWTSLAMTGADMLVGAGDGNAIEFARDGGDWRETRRWNQTDGADTFGKTIYCSADVGRLWVSDTDRQRVLVFDTVTGKLLASFGKPDQAGTDLMSLSHPGVIAARGDRAVVYDAGNQRLVKLSLQ